MDAVKHTEIALTASLRHDDFENTIRHIAEHKIAAAYNQAGDDYVAYADGDSSDLYSFHGQYAYGDSQSWNIIEQKLRALADHGTTSIRVLDLGCGPGTWLRRVVNRAIELGFEEIDARGIDVADGQIERAKASARELSRRPGIRLDFEVGDICERLHEADGSVDLCLCLYGVLNHVPAGDLGGVLGEIARVTSGYFIATVRAIGSTPTIYVENIEAARQFRQDNRLDRLDVELANGRHISFNSHLFGGAELGGLASEHFVVEDLRGLDLFHGRFAVDPRWNPPNATTTHALSCELDRLEQSYCREPEFIDHATHLMLVAKSRTPRYLDAKEK